ncbi:MAG: hypothetical protein FWD17_11855, partial [Polyangiaceae bacterium]|nr:hypothetical protein [Polyangiaceae bacterium]
MHHSVKYDRCTPKGVRRRAVASFASIPGALAVLTLAVLGTGGCSSGSSAPLARAGELREAVSASTCSYSVASEVNGMGASGFNAQVTVTNVAGQTSTGFSVLVNAGSAQLAQVSHGTFQSGEYGYVLTPVPSLASSQLNQGQTYSFELQFSGAYTELTANIVSNNGQTCDTTAPTVSLASSGSFFTSNATLSLDAQATDNVAVGQVVFADNGTAI